MSSLDPTGTPMVVPLQRRPKTEPFGSFDQLREQGMAYVRSLCGRTWTDHNLHDPGITILEQLCYGLSELCYRIDAPVADHLCGPRGDIALARQSLHPPETILPCRATTLADYRRLLVDALDGEHGVAIRADPASRLYRVAMHAPPHGSQGSAICQQILRRAYWRQRNLGEDLHPDIELIRKVPVKLQASIEIGGAADPADIIAEVLHRCSRFIAAPVEFTDLGAPWRGSEPLDQVFDGPALRNGFVTDEAIARQDEETLFVSQLLAQVRQVPGVVAVGRFGLVVPGPSADKARPVTDSLPWRGVDAQGRWMLGLDLSDARQQLDGMEVRRRLAEVHVAPDVLRSRLDELAAETRAARQRSQGAAAAPPRLRGQGHAATPYYSVQHHFPSVYGINAHGVPAAAGPARQAQARQLKAYLLLFEQLLANGQAQVDHLRDLLSAHRPSQSYWWQALDETSVPGMDALFWQPEDIEQQVYRPLDDHAMRKSRALDHLLGLYGEAFPEHSLRQFSGHLDPAQVDATLLGYKVALVKDLVKFGRDRAGGFDYSQPIDGSDDNRSGLQRRVGLLLGFPERRTPWLCARPSNSASEDQARSAAALVYALGPGEGWTRLPAVPSDTPTPDQRSDSVALPDLHQSDVTLLRAAAHPNRYWWDPGSAGHGRVLVDLGDGRCWHLADVAGPDAAARHAGRMRQAALAHDRSSEGMHVVEHLLLSTGASTDAADLTVVFAAWSVRCQHPGFRQLAQETVELNCPAQLRPRCLWLERPVMRQFEMLWGRWLEQKRIHCLGAPAEHAALDQAGAALAAWLRVAHDSRAEPPP